MSNSTIVTAVHPDSKIRILLRSALQDPTRTVLTDHSWADLLADAAAPRPSVIILHRSFIGQDCVDVLALFQERWPGIDIVVLPESLEDEGTRRDALIQLLRQVDQLLAPKSDVVLQEHPA